MSTTASFLFYTNISAVALKTCLPRNRFGTSLMYYGLSLNVGNFGLDIYLTQFIFGVVEIPARLGSLPLMQHFGRRICQVGVLVLGGSACLGILAIPKGEMIQDD